MVLLKKHEVFGVMEERRSAACWVLYKGGCETLETERVMCSASVLSH